MSNLATRVDRLAARRAPYSAAPADPGPLTDDEVKACLRQLFYAGSLAMTPDGVTIGAGPNPAPELAAELTVDMIAHPRALMVLLTRDEIARALATIDRGGMFMTWGTRGDGTRYDYHPFPRADDRERISPAAAELCAAVHTALGVVAAQTGQPLGYDVSGRLEDVRDWLIDLRDMLSEEP